MQACAESLCGKRSEKTTHLRAVGLSAHECMLTLKWTNRVRRKSDDVMLHTRGHNNTENQRVSLFLLAPHKKPSIPISESDQMLFSFGAVDWAMEE